MIPNTLSLKADAAGARYKALTDAWQALYGRALSSPEFGAAGQADKVVREAYDIAQVYLDREQDHISADLYEIAVEAQGLVSREIAHTDDELLAVAAQTHLGESQVYLKDEIAAQIHRDIANLRQTLQRAVLDVSVIARTRRLKERAAVVSWRLANDQTLDFNFTDRRSRRTPSARFIRGLWRQTMLSVFNETTLMTIADYGLKTAGVFKVEEGVVRKIETISLTGDGLGYADIRTDTFHPNSNAYLGVDHVSA